MLLTELSGHFMNRKLFIKKMYHYKNVFTFFYLSICKLFLSVILEKTRKTVIFVTGKNRHSPHLIFYKKKKKKKKKNSISRTVHLAYPYELKV